MLNHAADRIGHQRDCALRRMRDDEPVGQGHLPPRQAKTPAQVDHRNDAPLDVRHPAHDGRRARQRGDVNGANDAFDDGQRQGNAQGVEAKDNIFMHTSPHRNERCISIRRKPRLPGAIDTMPLFRSGDRQRRAEHSDAWFRMEIIDIVSKDTLNNSSIHR